VGEGEEAQYTLLALEEYLFSRQLHITLISSQSRLFETTPDYLKELWEKFVTKEQCTWDQDCQQYEKTLFQWRGLEDYEKTKIPMPQTPKRKLEIFLNSNVTSVDKLIDKNELFVTFETPEFRGQEQKEFLRTSATDMIFVLQGRKNYRNDFYGDMLEAKVFGPVENKQTDATETGLYKMNNKNDLSKIESDVMQYFGRRDA